MKIWPGLYVKIYDREFVIVENKICISLIDRAITNALKFWCQVEIVDNRLR